MVRQRVLIGKSCCWGIFLLLAITSAHPHERVEGDLSFLTVHSGEPSAGRRRHIEGTGASTQSIDALKAKKDVTPVSQRKLARLTSSFLFYFQWLDDETIKFELEVGTTGWIGIGFGRGMTNVDMYLFHVDDNGTIFEMDAWSKGNEMPKNDSDLPQGSKSIYVIEGSQSGGITKVVWLRNSDTGDIYDEIFQPGTRDITWAHGQGGPGSGHGISERGNAEVVVENTPLKDGEDPNAVSEAITVAQSSSRDAIYYIHGYTLYFLWVFLTPVATITVKWRKYKTYWLKVHKAINAIVAAITVPMAATMTSLGNNQDPKVLQHGFVGISLALTSMVMITTGKFLKYHISQEEGYFLRRLRVLHQIPGWACLIMGWMNCYIGVEIYAPHLRAPLIVNYTLIGLLFVALGTYYYFPNLAVFRKFNLGVDFEDAKSKRLLPALTIAEIRTYIDLGNYWLIKGNQILNLNDYRKYHPGGTSLISSMKGKDIMKFCHGNYATNSRINFHHHSLHAMKLMEKLRCAQIELPYGLIKSRKKLRFKMRRNSYIVNGSAPRWRLSDREKVGKNLIKLRFYHSELYANLGAPGVEWFGKYFHIREEVDGIESHRYYSFCPSLEKFNVFHADRAKKILKDLRRALASSTFITEATEIRDQLKAIEAIRLKDRKKKPVDPDTDNSRMALSDPQVMHELSDSHYLHSPRGEESPHEFLRKIGDKDDAIESEIELGFMSSTTMQKESPSGSPGLTSSSRTSSLSSSEVDEEERDKGYQTDGEMMKKRASGEVSYHSQHSHVASGIDPDNMRRSSKKKRSMGSVSSHRSTPAGYRGSPQKFSSQKRRSGDLPLRQILGTRSPQGILRRPATTDNGGMTTASTHKGGSVNGTSGLPFTRSPTSTPSRMQGGGGPLFRAMEMHQRGNSGNDNDNYVKRDDTGQVVFSHDGAISLYIKVYEAGKMTPHLAELPIGTEMYLEGPMGLGLGLTDYTEGNYVIFAAGTGILPFLDLIYFLYKKEMMIKKYEKVQANSEHELFMEGLPAEDRNYLENLENFRLTVFVSYMTYAEAIGFPLLVTAAKECEISKRLSIDITFTREPPEFWTGKYGRFSVEDISARLPSKITRAWICGPNAYCWSMREVLEVNGLDSEFIELL